LCQHVQRFTLKFGIRLKTLLCTEERWSFAKVHMQKHGKYQEARAWLFKGEVWKLYLRRTTLICIADRLPDRRRDGRPNVNARPRRQAVAQKAAKLRKNALQQSRKSAIKKPENKRLLECWHEHRRKTHKNQCELQNQPKERSRRVGRGRGRLP
jgi:hypothetical protein